MGRFKCLAALLPAGCLPAACLPAACWLPVNAHVDEAPGVGVLPVTGVSAAAVFMA